MAGSLATQLNLLCKLDIVQGKGDLITSISWVTDLVPVTNKARAGCMILT